MLTCSQVDVKIPTDIAPGDYLLRAEVIALHVAGSLNQAQFYASCYQITVAGSGSATPSGVLFPGAYKNTDPGILIDIHQKISTYVDPGPTVYAGGVSKTPGNSKCTGQAASEGPGGKPATGVSYETVTDEKENWHVLTCLRRLCTLPAPAVTQPPFLPPLPSALPPLPPLGLRPPLLPRHQAAEAAQSQSMDSAAVLGTLDAPLVP